MEPEHEGVLGTTGNELCHEAWKRVLRGHGGARQASEEQACGKSLLL